MKGRSTSSVAKEDSHILTTSVRRDDCWSALFVKRARIECASSYRPVCIAALKSRLCISVRSWGAPASSFSDLINWRDNLAKSMTNENIFSLSKSATMCE